MYIFYERIILYIHKIALSKPIPSELDLFIVIDQESVRAVAPGSS
jgi:hypothetical protein